MDINTLATVLIAEWESLRTESLEAIERRVNLMSWGTAAYGALASAAAWLVGEGSQYEAAVFWLLCAGLPFQAISLAALWAGESKRSDRAGLYMAALETDLERLLAAARDDSSPAVAEWLRTRGSRPHTGIGWETFLRLERRHSPGIWRSAQLELPYIFTATYLLAMVWAPLIAAWYFAHGRWNQNHPGPLLVGIVCTASLIVMAIWFRQTRR